MVPSYRLLYSGIILFLKVSDNKMKDNYFKMADDLNDNIYFKPAGDLDINKQEEKNNFNELEKNKIEDYLLTIVSGKKYNSEFGTVMDAGTMIVSFEKLVNMVDEGYNIIRANIINIDKKWIEVEFQKCISKKDKTGKGR